MLRQPGLAVVHQGLHLSEMRGARVGLHVGYLDHVLDLGVAVGRLAAAVGGRGDGGGKRSAHCSCSLAHATASACASSASSHVGVRWNGASSTDLWSLPSVRNTMVSNSSGGPSPQL